MSERQVISVAGENQPLPGPQRQTFDSQDPPPRAPGPQGVNDQADPNSPQKLRYGPEYPDEADSKIPQGEVVLVDSKIHVIYLREVRAGGSSAWLANDPGNMDYTEEQVKYGAFRDKGLPWGSHKFAIFPDEDFGLNAVRMFLRAHQTIRSIRLMQMLFAPKGDGKNDPDAYAKAIVKALNAQPPTITPTKVTVETLVKDLSDAQIEVYANTIKQEEGWDRDKDKRQTWKLDDPTLPREVQDRLAKGR
jgi:hypothetical protein